MNRLPSLVIAATLALLGVSSVSTAQAHELPWTGEGRMDWSKPSTGCKLWVQQVSRPVPGQPIRMVVKNVAKIPLKYAFNVRVLVSERETYHGRVEVGNALAGQVSEASTITTYPGNIVGNPRATTVMLSMTSCSASG